jgi:hypothetical protein
MHASGIVNLLLTSTLMVWWADVPEDEILAEMGTSMSFSPVTNILNDRQRYG